MPKPASLFLTALHPLHQRPQAHAGGRSRILRRLCSPTSPVAQWLVLRRSQRASSGEEFGALEEKSVSNCLQGNSFHMELTRGCVSLERSDDSRLGDLVRTTVVHIDGLKEKHVTLLSNTRGNCLHDLAVDRLLVISNQVLVEQLLDLVR